MVVEGADANEMSEAELVRHIVGDVVDEDWRPHLPPAESAHYRLEVENLFGITLRGVSFKIRSGEVVGVSGLIGSGRDEIAGTVFGATPRFFGKVLVDKQKVFAAPRDAIRGGDGLRSRGPPASRSSAPSPDL